MASRRVVTKKQPIHGVLLLDKPLGITSNAALQRVKWLLNAKKVGHTGSLDPLASGMLPLCFGEATKFSQYLLDADKRYFVKAKLGVRTNTSDQEGEIIATHAVPSFTVHDIDRALDAFRGEIDQIPSMFSALKHQGQPLYKLARQGVAIERKPRRITVYEISSLDYQHDVVTFTVHCSKGTYIRTLVDDLGECLGCGAHVICLRRLSVAHFREAQMITMECIEKSDDILHHLLPVESAVSEWPEMMLEENTARCVLQGQMVQVPNLVADAGWLRLLNHEGRFMGVGEIVGDGKVAPRRLVSQSP